MGKENYQQWWAAMHDPEVVPGMLEDYRAGLGVDADHERADRAAGHRVDQPLLVVWSTYDDLEDLYGDPLVIWRDWATSSLGTASSPATTSVKKRPTTSRRHSVTSSCQRLNEPSLTETVSR